MTDTSKFTVNLLSFKIPKHMQNADTSARIMCKVSQHYNTVTMNHVHRQTAKVT